MKRVETIDLHPVNWRARDEERRGRITCRKRKYNQDRCEGLIQVVGRRGYKIREFINQNRGIGIGRVLEAIRGSKEVKMSGNIYTYLDGIRVKLGLYGWTLKFYVSISQSQSNEGIE